VQSKTANLLYVLRHLVVLLIADHPVQLPLLAVNEKLLVDHLLNVFVVLDVQSKFLCLLRFLFLK
jgi:hypothetical protein